MNGMADIRDQETRVHIISEKCSIEKCRPIVNEDGR